MIVYSHSEVGAQVIVCVYENRGISVSSSFANAESDGTTPEPGSTVAEHAQDEEIPLRELTLLDQLI